MVSGVSVSDILILAIDDDTGRYDGLRRHVEARAATGRDNIRLVVATCPACVASHLPHAAVVLLDYDLDGGDLCCFCDGLVTERTKGIHYAGDIAKRGVPVIVTSCSSIENVRRLVGDLRRRGVEVAQHPAFESECELRWLGRLAVWGML